MTSKISKLCIGVLVFLVGISSAADIQHFNMIRDVVKSYRFECSVNDMKINNDGKEDSFRMIIKSNRNNFEAAMMAGFIAVGDAMKSNFGVKKVTIDVHVPLAEGFVWSGTASREDILKLMNGQVDMAQFFRLVKF